MGRYRKLKQCPGCGTADLTQFGKNKARRDGLQTYCRGCTKSLRSWSSDRRVLTVSQKKQYDALLVEQYIAHRISQE